MKTNDVRKALITECVSDKVIRLAIEFSVFSTKVKEQGFQVANKT